MPEPDIDAPPKYVLAQQAQLDRIEAALTEMFTLLAHYKPLLDAADKRLKRQSFFTKPTGGTSGR